MSAPDDKWHEQYAVTVKSVTRLAAMLENYEEERKEIFSQEVVNQGEVAVARAEHVARTSFEYVAKSAEVRETRTRLANARGALADMDRRWETWRTNSSNLRNNIT